MIRELVRAAPGMRNLVYLTTAVAAAAGDTRRRRERQATSSYEQSPDPWGYASPWGSEHLACIRRLVDHIEPGHPLTRGLDIGCGDGAATEILAALCDQVLAIDLSEMALRRARARALGDHVCFARTDLLGAADLGTHDVVFALGVIEVFRRPRMARRAARRVAAAVLPGGHLIVTTTRQSPVIETARWGRSLYVGASGVDHLVRSIAPFCIVASEETDTHLLSLYRLASR